MENDVIIGKYKYRINNNNIQVYYNNEWKDVPKNYLNYNLLYNDIISSLTPVEKSNSNSFRGAGASGKWTSNNEQFFHKLGQTMIDAGFGALKYMFKNPPVHTISITPSGPAYTGTSPKQVLKAIIGNEHYGDLKGILTDSNLSFKDKLDMLEYGFKRKFKSNYDGDDMSEKARNTEIILELSNKNQLDLGLSDPYVISKILADTSYNISNDTTFFPGRRLFSVPRSINLKNVKLGSRNRGDRSEFYARDVMGTYRPIVSYDEGIKSGRFRPIDSEGHINEFMGYDPNGNFKIGTLDKFNSGDTMALVYYGYVHNIPRDLNGDPYLVQAAKDSRRLSPKYIGYGEDFYDGRDKPLKEDAFLLMTPKRIEIKQSGNTGLNLFNDVVGGGYILNADDEYRLVRGSINNVLDEIEKMRVNHKNNPDIKVYLIDNGSYSRGMMTVDNKYTSRDLTIYDKQTPEAGHFFYIKPEGFPIERCGGKLVSKNPIQRFKNI